MFIVLLPRTRGRTYVYYLVMVHGRYCSRDECASFTYNKLDAFYDVHMIVRIKTNNKKSRV